ncbi:MAG: ATP-binding protein [candidate division KSB1 bacterium]|nr:ATP-binding protein [candidate division KSB1 bacterium]
MKELVIISGKGGTGKTTVTGSFAALAENAVLADADVDAANLHVLMRPVVQEKHTFSGGKQAWIDPQLCNPCGRCTEVCRFDAITGDFQVDPVACEGCGVCVWNCPLQAIQFNSRENGEWYFSKTRFGPAVHAKLGIAEENSGKLVTLVRQKAKMIAEENKHDLLIVDGPPGTGCPVIAAIGGASYLLIVTEPTLSAIHDMKRVIGMAEHFDVPTGICINKYDLQEELTKSIRNFCEQKEIPILGTIPFDPGIVHAQVNAQTPVEIGNSELETVFRSLWKNTIKELNAV